MAEGQTKTIRWSDEAKTQFREILEFYFARNQSFRYCDALQELVEKKLERIRRFPEWGEEIKNSSARFVVVDKFLLIYDIVDDFIVIETIVDARRDVSLD